jgi:hypothetical protein
MGTLAGTIITIAGAGVISAFAEAICEKVNKPDYAQFIRITGFSLAGIVVINVTIAFFKALSHI